MKRKLSIELGKRSMLLLDELEKEQDINSILTKWKELKLQSQNKRKIRHSIYTVDEILPILEDKVNKHKQRIQLKDIQVRNSSLRLVNFKLHGIKCVQCGIEGKFFAAEKTNIKDPFYHLNLYALKEEKEILMTKDHIIHYCRGGSNNITNVQTMCQPCNNLKGCEII